MPPKPKTQEEISNEKETILNNALILIVEKGYLGLTMRDLAKLCNFSPTKIYYYFSNKDDIVMHIMQRGYELLSELTLSALEKETTLKGRSECACRELFNFGIQYKEYFNLMFAINVPRSTDFLSDEAIKDRANNYKNIAFSYYDLFSQCLIEYAESNNVILHELQILSIFSHILGVLKLNSGKITHVLNVDVDKLFNFALKDIISLLEK